MNLATWVLVGGVAGILAGITFGESCAILSPIGFVYVGLLRAAVYPYLICSLLHGLGSLDPAKAWRLFNSGWLSYLAAWVVTFVCLAALARCRRRVGASCATCCTGKSSLADADASDLAAYEVPRSACRASPFLPCVPNPLIRARTDSAPWPPARCQSALA